MKGGLNDLLLPGQAEPVSSCELELDCFAGDILNSLEVQGLPTEFIPN